MGCVFPAISMEKGCKNHKETLYFSKRKIVYLGGNPVIFTDCGGKPYDNYRIYLQSRNKIGFPNNLHNFSL